MMRPHMLEMNDTAARSYHLSSVVPIAICSHIPNDLMAEELGDLRSL
jgi:hypothetical protein